METTPHLLYTLTADDLLKEQFDSEQIKLMSSMLTGIKESILSKTDDFERWDTSTSDVLNKILEEVQLGVVFRGSKIHQTLLNRPETFWSLLRLSDSKEGLEFFFKLLGVSDGVETTLPLKTSKFYLGREDVTDLNTCDVSIEIDSSTINDSELLQSKLEAINIFNVLKMGVCIEYDVKLHLSAVKAPFTSLATVEERYNFLAPTVQHYKYAVTDFTIRGFGQTTEGYSFKTPTFKIEGLKREPFTILTVVTSEDRAVFKTPTFEL